MVATFAVLADTHTRSEKEKNNFTTKNLEKAMDFLLSYTGGNLDTVLIAGDLTDGGAFAQITSFAEVMNEKLSDKGTPILFSIGNHDMMSSGNMSSSTQRELYSAAYSADIDTGMTDANCRHSVVNGIHFIQVSADAYKPGADHYAGKTRQWLKNSLDLAVADNPGMPIFVATHLPVEGTVFGSDAYFEQYATTLSWASEDLEGLLSEYPQVVLVTGHTHYPQHAENSILQDKFTMVNVGTLNYMVIDNWFENESSAPTGCAEHPSGMLFEVDKNGATRITRFDFSMRKEIGSAWVLDAPGTPNALKNYDRSRANLVNTFPVKDAAVTASGEGTRRALKLTFTSADSSDNRVYYYQVDVKATNSSASKSLKFVTDFYLKPQAEKMKAKQSLNLGEYTIGATYTITVTPYNTWGVAGESQSTTITLS